MENSIKTSNIISTPNITGNIGSCTTDVKRQLTQNGLFRSLGYTIQTNSCTGEVKQYEYSQVNGVAYFFGAVIVLGAALLALGIILEKTSHNRYD